MSKKFELTGKIPMKGHNVSHANKNNKRRFLPNLKLIYFPFSVNKDSAPFKYALGSDKINDEYLNFFLKNKKWVFDERNLEAKKFLKNTIEVPLQENSLVIALTNGFHARTPFRAKTDRSALFFSYPNFNLLSLFSKKLKLNIVY